MKDIEKIVPKDIKITDIHGNELTIKPISMGVELEVISIIQKAVSDKAVNIQDAGKMTTEEFMLKLTSNSKMHKYLFEIFSICIGKLPDWIKDNLELFEVLVALTPFFAEILKKFRMMEEMLGSAVK